MKDRASAVSYKAFPYYMNQKAWSFRISLTGEVRGLFEGSKVTAVARNHRDEEAKKLLSTVHFISIK